MILEIIKQLRTGLVLLMVLTIITGLLYPLAVTGIAQLLFSYRANGSLILQNDKVIGSELIGQAFSSNKYFWSRPSATTPYPYNALSSQGSNLGPMSPEFLAGVAKRIAALQHSDATLREGFPVDLVTASASGLDPEISPYAALYQVERVAAARNLESAELTKLIQELTQGRTLFFLGEPRVNVLQLNLALDSLKSPSDLNKEVR